MGEPMREFLDSAKWARLKVTRLSRKVAELTTQVEHMTANYSGMPKGSGGDATAAWTTLAQLRSDYEAELVEAERAEKEVLDFVNTMDRPIHREILALRYCENLSWPRVVEAMQAAGYYYSDRQIFRIHGDALNEAREKWRMKNNEERRCS